MNGNDMAFPVRAVDAPNKCEQYGLTKREYFALHLMAGSVSQCGTSELESTAKYEVRMAVMYADALIAELSK